MNGDVQFHEAANIFPLMEGDDLQGLAADIEEHGLRTPIELLDGKIIDGRNRKTACLMAGVDPDFIKVHTDDPVAYVISANLRRRQLTPSQIAASAVLAEELYAKEREKAKQRMQAGKKSDPTEMLREGAKGETNEKIGKAFGVSGRTVDHAKKVRDKGIPELFKAVQEGRMAANTAALLATEPPGVQRETLESGRHNRKYGSGPGASRRSREEREPEPERGTPRGVGILRANEAIDILSRIPRKDPTRRRAFQIVADWIKANR